MFSDKNEMVYYQYTDLHKRNSLKDYFRRRKNESRKKDWKKVKQKKNSKYVSKSNADLHNRMMIIMIIFV